ncbi:hypothetical protein H0H92_014306, partial [Tricholoma furcatifolium]
GSLRRRFSYSLLWYNALRDATASCADDVLVITRNTKFYLNHEEELVQQNIELVHPLDEAEPFSSPTFRLLDLSPSSKRPASKRSETDIDTEETHNNPFPDPIHRIRPSEYLRSRCPLCFGGQSVYLHEENNKRTPDAIVCVDACFTQKHNRRAGVDPPITHPRTVFLAEDKIRSTERYIESLRPSRTTAADKRQKQKTGDEADVFEHSHHGSLRVPKSPARSSSTKQL